MAGQPPLPPGSLRDSSTPEENQHSSAHERKEREQRSMGKGTRRMLLACLIPAAALACLWEMALASLPAPHSRASSARGGHSLQPHLWCPQSCRGIGGEDGEAAPLPHPKPPSLCGAGARREPELFLTSAKLSKVGRAPKTFCDAGIAHAREEPSSHTGTPRLPDPAPHTPPAASGGCPHLRALPAMGFHGLCPCHPPVTPTKCSSIQFISNRHRLPSLLGASRGQQPQSEEIHLDSCFPSPALPEGPLEKQLIFNRGKRTMFLLLPALTDRCLLQGEP